MEQKQNWLERPIHSSLPNVTNEVVIFAGIILLAIVTRFYNLGARVMSHDESLHTYFSWLLYRGQGYQHSPMMHGPWQFHWIALSYFLFGASDFTARIPAATFSILLIGMMWFWRRFLGKTGALIAAFLLVISPMMLYYGRYVREDVYAYFSGAFMLYTVLRYLENGERKFLYLFSAAVVIHYLAKETSYIYTAQLLIFLAIYFIARVVRRSWKNAESDYRAFMIALGITVLFAGAAAVSFLYARETGTLSGTETVMPSDPSMMESPLAAPTAATSPLLIVLAVIAVLAFIAAARFLIRGYTWERLRSERSFDLLMVSGTLVLPLLSPLAVNALQGWLNVTIPTEAAEVQAMAGDLKSILVVVGFLVLMFAVSTVIGLWWDKEKWWKVALVFWIPYTILYTTIFTNSDGFFTGTIGSLGYWLVQQGVERGSQPWYYYVLIQIPIYEFLPALGLILAIIIGLRRKPRLNNTEEDIVNDDEVITLIENEETNTEERSFPNTFSLLAFWSIITIASLTYAGERMPWLTTHMAWPMILITGWALGYVIDTTNWSILKEKRVPLTIAALGIFIVSSMGMLLALSGTTPPFQGRELAQLQATSAFLLPSVVTILSAIAVIYLFKDWTFGEIKRVFVLMVFGFLAILTVRTSFRASYITYDQATEFLVYAHGATGVKEVIEQAKEISERTTGGMGVALAYDASAPDTGVSWPFVWYLRDFTNQRSFDKPTRSLRDSVIVIVDEKNFDSIEAALGPGFYRVDYIRMWWPMQDYFSLSFDRDPTQPFPEDYACSGLLSFYKLFKSKDYTTFCEAFTNPEIRAGIIQIWLNRDYTAYAQAKGRQDLDVSTWNPSDKMRLYIRQDVAAQIWNYGVAPTTQATAEDPTEGKYVLLPADLVLQPQSNQISLNAPRSLAFANDGTIYVADSRNHRVLHLDAQGNVLQEWGTFADGVNSPVENGTLNEPWGIAVAADGSVYVTDTWNHRIEKFTRDGKFVTAWGIFGQGETPDAFYGPRGLAVDAEGRVYVTDTGNKRIVVFDANGNFITQFGSAGFEPGQFDEPVGITIDKNGTVYVVDTWNQRIQTFTPIEAEDGTLSFVPEKQWDVYGWFGQSLENKPFIAVNDDLHVFITDPDGYRVMEFDPDGQVVRTWGDFGDSNSGFGLPSGIAIDNEGKVWVTDAVYNRIMRFTLP